MKRALILSLMLGAATVALPTTDANAATTNSIGQPQINVQIGGNNRRRGYNNRRARIVTTTRVTRAGAFRYRETIRTTYLPNGRTRTEVINRVRLAGGRGMRNY